MTDYLKFTHFKWNYDRAEIIADGIVHGIGIVAALIGATALIFYGFVWGTAGTIAASWIYGLGLVGALAISFTYNIWPVSRTKWILRRFDHSAIFVLIGATYTPFLVRGADDWRVASLLALVWTMAGFGIFMKFRFPGRYDRLAILFYMAMGWCGLAAAGPLWGRLDGTTLLLILIGGIIYSLGVIFHVWEKLRFQNAIWHGFVVSAAAVHYVAVFQACQA